MAGKSKSVALWKTILPITLAVFFVTPSLAADWTFEAHLGSPWNFPTNLTIDQDGEEKISLTADYEEKAFEMPFYYSYRVGFWSAGRSWELELLHHKIYLTNEPPEVQFFSVSHGYNLLTVNRAWEAKALIWRIGGGLVIAHPESTVRNRILDTSRGILEMGYYLAGPTVQAALQKRFHLSESFFLSLETKLTVSWATVPVDGGEANVPNAALHLLGGLGFSF